MSGPDPRDAGSRPPSGESSGPVDEFDWIERLLRPLAEGAPEALGLQDDAAVAPSRPGWDLVITTDAIVEGVHFLADDPLDLVAGKLLRVNLSDLAAKGAEPYGYLLSIAWPAGSGWSERRAFVQGLRADQTRFGLRLFGGDTVSTPGPLTVSATLLGWVPHGRMVRRAGARPGDRVLVTGTIGDGGLGLEAAQGRLAGLEIGQAAWLRGRYQTPQPRIALADALRAHAHAAADVSDGLLADAGWLARAGGVRLEIDLDRLPLSTAAMAWLALQPDRAAARLRLASAGDDYEIVCATPASAVADLAAMARTHGVALTDIGLVAEGQGLIVRDEGRILSPERTGWRHG